MKPKNFTQRFEFWMTEKQNRQLEELAAYYHQSQGAILRDAIGQLYVAMTIQVDRANRLKPPEVNHIS